MALVLSHLRFLLSQSDIFPVAVDGGRVLCLGVQDVHASHQELAETIGAAGIRVSDVPSNERRYTESQIVHRQQQHAHISDVFRMLGYSEVATVDFSEAESPDIIHDLNEPVPRELHEQFDLVFDIGVVEHICDIFQALSNCMAMVKPGGAVMHIVPLHGWHNMTFFNFQPMYLQEVYAANGFEPTRTYINFYPQFDEWTDQQMQYREYHYGDEMLFQLPRKLTNICFFAKKGKSIQELAKPIQGFYMRYHGEADLADAPAPELDGRLAADVKRRIPSWLLEPLIALNRARLRLEDLLLPRALRERLWCWRRRRIIVALDRVRERKDFWI
jgi:hypothetical protein